MTRRALGGRCVNGRSRLQDLDDGPIGRRPPFLIHSRKRIHQKQDHRAVAMIGSQKQVVYWFTRSYRRAKFLRGFWKQSAFLQRVSLGLRSAQTQEREYLIRAPQAIAFRVEFPNPAAWSGRGFAYPAGFPQGRNRDFGFRDSGKQSLKLVERSLDGHIHPTPEPALDTASRRGFRGHTR